MTHTGQEAAEELKNRVYMYVAEHFSARRETGVTPFNIDVAADMKRVVRHASDRNFSAWMKQGVSNGYVDDVTIDIMRNINKLERKRKNAWEPDEDVEADDDDDVVFKKPSVADARLSTKNSGTDASIDASASAFKSSSNSSGSGAAIAASSTVTATATASTAKELLTADSVDGKEKQQTKSRLHSYVISSDDEEEDVEQEDDDDETESLTASTRTPPIVQKVTTRSSKSSPVATREYRYWGMRVDVDVRYTDDKALTRDGEPKEGMKALVVRSDVSPVPTWYVLGEYKVDEKWVFKGHHVPYRMVLILTDSKWTEKEVRVQARAAFRAGEKYRPHTKYFNVGAPEGVDKAVDYFAKMFTDCSGEKLKAMRALLEKCLTA